MSIVGAISGSPQCQNCGEPYGGNSLHLGDADFKNSFAPNVAYTGSAFGDGIVYVCDLCLFAALRVAFGHLLLAARKEVA